MNKFAFFLLLTFLFFLRINLSAQEETGKPISKDETGLLVGEFNPDEPVAKTKAESMLSLKPRRGRNQNKPFYLYVPTTYKKQKPMPLVIVLHRRGEIRGFTRHHSFKSKDLEKYTTKELNAWKTIAEKKGFILALPIADAESLWIGVSWFTNDRTKVIASQIEEVQKTHSIDNSRVYLVGMNEGAHAILSTTVRQGGIIAAAAICNPPLFDGNADIVKNEKNKNTVMPETIDEMVKVAHKRKAGLMILAGKADKKLKIAHHGIGGGTAKKPLIRYEDSSKIPLAHMKKMAQLLDKAGFKNKFVTIEGGHYSPIPNNQIKNIWEFLSTQKIPKEHQQSAAAINKEIQDKIDAIRKAKREANAKIKAAYDAAKLAHKEKKYEDAIQEYINLLPKVHGKSKSMIYYNLSRSYAKNNKKSEAIEALKNSVKLGYTDTKNINADPDFQEIKSDEKFKEVIKLAEQMVELRKKQMEYIKKLMKKNKHLKVDIQ